MAQVYGPSGAGCINADCFVTVTPPPPPPVPVTKINPADPKVGPPLPASLGGTSKSGHGNQDSYWR